MNTRRRSGRRITLAVAALAVSGASVGIAVAGTASAAGTGTCTDTVNVRSEPSKTAPVVGTCEKGQSTRVGKTKNGFVRLDEFGGWASAEYVKTGSASEGRTAPNRAGDAGEAQSPSTAGQGRDRSAPEGRSGEQGDSGRTTDRTGSGGTGGSGSGDSSGSDTGSTGGAGGTGSPVGGLTG